MLSKRQYHRERYAPYIPRKCIPAEPQGQPFLVYYDCESTGLDVYNDTIIEMAATIESSMEQYVTGRKSFERLVFTYRNINPRAFAVHGISSEDLEDAKPFPEVLKRFLKWLRSRREEISSATGIPHYPVLVAHNGYGFDYKMLASEMKRHAIDSSCFDGIKFSDSLHHLRQKQQQGCPPLSGMRLGLETLCKTYFPPEKDPRGHRALKDAENLKWLFGNNPLNTLLPLTSKYSYSDLP